MPMTVHEITTEPGHDSSAPTGGPARDLGRDPEAPRGGEARELPATEENPAEGTDGPEVQVLPMAEESSPPTRSRPRRHRIPAPRGRESMSAAEAAGNAQEATFPDRDADEVEVITNELSFPDRETGGDATAPVSNLIDRDPPGRTDPQAGTGSGGRALPVNAAIVWWFSIFAGAGRMVRGRPDGHGCRYVESPAGDPRGKSALRRGELRFHCRRIRFLVVAFTARSGLSTPFRVDLSLALEEAYPVDEVLGAGGTLLVEMEEGERHVNGIVNRFVQTGVKGSYRLFKAQLVPQVWLLGLEQDCRIFQDKSVPDIIREVLEGAGIPGDGFEFRTRNNFMRRSYCVQYRESHLDFISRLAEEEGLYYYFEHESRRHKIVFGEGTLAYQQLDGDRTLLYQPSEGLAPEEEVVLELELARQIQPTKVTLRDFDFKRPSLEMTAERDENRREENERQQRTLEWFELSGPIHRTGPGEPLRRPSGCRSG